MKILVAVVLLTVLALIGSRRMKGLRGLPQPVQRFFGGAEYLIIGVMLGDGFLALVDSDVLDRLQPFIAVILGWVGFLFGLQFDRRTVRNLPQGFLTISGIAASVTILVVAPVAWMLLSRLGFGWRDGLVAACAALAASAACSGHTGLAFVGPVRGRGSRNAVTVLRFISSLDPAVGVVVFGLVVSVVAPHPIGGVSLLWSLQWVVVACSLAFLTAWVFVSLTLTRTSQAELVLYLLGTIALASGIALAFGLSTLLVCFLCGVVFANLAHVRSVRGRTMNVLVRGERFLYLILLVLAGAAWSVPTGGVVVAAVTYVVARVLGKVLGFAVATRRLTRPHPVPLLAGLGTLSQGGMGVAIVVEYMLLIEAPVTAMVLGVALLAIVVNELLAPWLTPAVVHRAEELGE